jgi:putative oxidoreductase
MDILHLVGRIVFGGFFVTNGIKHFRNVEEMGTWADAKDMPAPRVAVVVSGLFLVLGGLSIMTGYMREFGLTLLIAFLVPVAFIMHNFWSVPKERRGEQRVQFLKNLALLGATLMLFAFLDEPWPFSLGD